MSNSKNISNKKQDLAHSYEDFWEWFQENEKTFFKVIKEEGNMEKDFFDVLSTKLNQIKDGFFFLVGMHDHNTAELVITADGFIKNIVFVEELVKAAPKLETWKFTALKPALNINDVSIEMAGYDFSSANMGFYANNDSNYPDEIDITIVHDDFNKENKAIITNGVYILLDNYLGELNFATTIDKLTVIGKDDAEKELVPIDKLNDFLIWRQKEFIEKYDGIRYNTENDNYSGLEGELKNGNPLIVVLNTDILKWDVKASHPWILTIEMRYDGKNNLGMPDEETYNLLSEIEEKVIAELKDFEGYLNIGRQTADGIREIYFACKDFRKPSLVLHQIQATYGKKIEISHDIYKDKYWQSFEQFNYTR